jgi:hypothetical protein
MGFFLKWLVDFKKSSENRSQYDSGSWRLLLDQLQQFA